MYYLVELAYLIIILPRTFLKVFERWNPTMPFLTPPNQFFQLIPKGTGFEPNERGWHMEPDALDLEIQNTRLEALQCLDIKRDDMTTVYSWEKDSISKPEYVLKKGGLTRQQIHILITDRDLLFNRKYQHFNSDNGYYKQERKKLKQKRPESSFHDAVQQTPKTFHPVFSEEERDNYPQWKKRYNYLNALMHEAKIGSQQISSSLSDALSFLELYSEKELNSFLITANRATEHSRAKYLLKNAIYQEQVLPHLSEINQVAAAYVKEARQKDVSTNAEAMLRSVLMAFEPNSTEVDKPEMITVFVIACAKCPQFLYESSQTRNMWISASTDETDEIADEIFNDLFRLRKSNANSYFNLYRLLSQLMDIFQFDDASRRNCNMYFDRLVFGDTPKFFSGEYEKLKDQYEYLSPTAKYLVTAIDDLEQCMDPEPQHLSGYRFGSLLHKGGFARFLNQYPMMVPNVIKRVESSDELQKLQGYYQKKDSLPVYRLDKIKQMFTDEVLQSFRLTGISTEETDTFFSTLAGKSLTKRELETNRNELKSLLAELSFREYYIQKARKVLLRAFLYQDE